LHKELSDALGALNRAVNRVRVSTRQLVELQGRLADMQQEGLRKQVAAIVERLEAVEAVLVNVKRESPRDVLRHPAGLNDGLLDLINVVVIADAAPPQQARDVSNEVMGKVNAEIAKLAKLDGEIGQLNAQLQAANVTPIAAPKPG
jgi:hypothetical protein